MKEKDKGDRMRGMLIESNRRLQETAQKLLMINQNYPEKRPNEYTNDCS